MIETTATQARDAAIANAEGGANVLFMTAARNAIIAAATYHAELTTDDVEKHCNMTPDEPRAWGAAMMRAAKDGIIERTERTRQSKNRVCHAREKRIWRSRIFEPPTALFEEAPPTSYGSI